MRVNQSAGNQAQAANVSGAKSAKENAAAAQAKKGEKAQASQAAERANVPGSVKTEISPKAKEMAKDVATAKAVAKQAPEVREDKIAEIKARLAGGNYKVDAQAVADRMVDDHLKSGIG